MNQKKIDELLAVLDMPEEKQQMWLIYKQRIEPTESLADLAFKLRDEVIKKYKGQFNPIDSWVRGIIKVCSKFDWFLYDWNILAQPIHWIIAALVAKEIESK